MLFAPALNILAWFHHPAWLLGYPLFFAFGFMVTAFSLAITVGLFRIVGAKKTRLISQIIAAIVGASFIIGIQLAAISSIGRFSRIEFLNSVAVINAVPDLSSWVWLPANALMGDIGAFLFFMASATALLLGSIQVFSEKFGERVLLASNFAGSNLVNKTRQHSFAKRSIRAHLRHKEWRLLLRDHWLISQTLMQILYLLPPAFMLWQGFGDRGALDVVVIPVLVMATGQLAGGLAWLAISGEDAPDLVTTAPVASGAIIRAKMEAVLGAIAMLTAPILLLLVFFDWHLALVAAGLITVATLSATMIQLWFRSQAKRSNFRRRQTSSKIATITEAFSSILWAGTAGMLAIGTWLAIVPAALALAILIVARSFRPIE